MNTMMKVLLDRLNSECIGTELKKPWEEEVLQRDFCSINGISYNPQYHMCQPCKKNVLLAQMFKTIKDNIEILRECSVAHDYKQTNRIIETCTRCGGNRVI